MTFYSETEDDKKILLKVSITPLGDPLLPNVFNLAFGPLLPNGQIDDNAKINHRNKSKTFSTILLFAFGWLQIHADATIGLDGSNDIRAYLYHRMFLTNRHLLNDFFISIGVDWYVRLLRDGSVEADANGIPYFKPKPEPFDYGRPAANLYRYYLLQLKR